MTAEQTIEERLQAALAARAASVDGVVGDPGPVTASAPVRRAVWQRHPTASAGLVVAAALALLLGVVVLRSDGDREQQVVSDGSTTSQPSGTAAPGSSVVTTSISPPSSQQATVVPPNGSVTSDAVRPTTTRAAQVDRSITGWPARGSTQHATAKAAAAAFVRSVLDFAEPTFRRANGEDAAIGATAQITYSARRTAGAETTIVAVRNGERSWLVQGATSNQGTITKATFSEGRIDVTGEGTAFEATITVRALALGGKKLGEDFTMGGANGERAPFAGSVSYTGARAGFVLVGESDASGEGDLGWACVVLDRALP